MKVVASLLLALSLSACNTKAPPMNAPSYDVVITNAQIVVFETEIEKMALPETQMKMLSKAQLPEGQTLRQQLSPATYASFTNHTSQAGLPLEMFDQFTPSIAAMMLEVLELQKLGVDPEMGVDAHFFERARKAGKKIVPLETADFQIEMATSFSKEEGELLMKSTLKEIDNAKKAYGEIVSAWQNGDAAKLEKFLNDAMRESPPIFKRLVTDRNHRWVPKIEELLNGSRNAIVIVGAAHLVGNEGVVELLKKKGLKVTQL